MVLLKKWTSILFCLLLFEGVVWAQENLPLKINSNKMTYLQNKNLVVFEGEVKASDGQMFLDADKLEVYLKGDSNKKIGYQEQEIDKIVALGQVVIKKDDRVAKCGRAVYYPARKEVRLEENPSIWQEKNVISGEVILFYLNTNSAKVLGGKQKRVEAVFYPKQGQISE